MERLRTLSDLSSFREGFEKQWHQIAPGSEGRQPRPLIAGTEEFADSWLVDWHSKPKVWEKRDVGAYMLQDTVISGEGQIWLDQFLIVSPEVMPDYVFDLLNISTGGNERVHRFRSLPIRTIDGPCVVAIGHGTRIYGHFLIEMLFRILVGQRTAFGNGEKDCRILLRHDTPEWLLRILTGDLGVAQRDLEFFRNTEEQICLRKAIVPTLLLQNGHFLPFAEDLLEALVGKLDIRKGLQGSSRVFVIRKNFQNPASPFRRCLNEQELIDLATTRHGFAAVASEELNWRTQIGMFRDASIILGLAGSGLHNSIFSNERIRIASIGAMNVVQSQIGALKGHENAFFSKNIKLDGEFKVDVDKFERYLSIVCASASS